MTIEDRIRRHLEETTSGLTAPGRLEEVMAEGHRRRIRRGTFSVLGAAAVIAAVVSLAPMLMTDDTGGAPTQSVATQPATPSTSVDPTTSSPATPVTGAAPRGMLSVESGVVRVLDLEGSTVGELGVDGVLTAYPDQAGGLVLALDSPAIRRLPPGGTDLVEFVPAPAEGGTVPIGPGLSPTGEPLFFYIEDSQALRIMAIQVAAGDPTEVAELAESVDVTAGGSRLALVDRSDDCPTLRLLDLRSGEIPSPLAEDCLPVAVGVSVSSDGRYLGVLVGDDFRAVSIDSGETVLERSFPGAYMATAGPGGWVIRTPSETVVLATGGESWTLPPVGQQAWAIPYAQPLDLPSDSTPTSEANDEVPEEGTSCPAAEVSSPHQDLPDAVASTRLQLWELATACDASGLAQLAQADQTILSFGGIDPVTYWEEAGEEEMTILARLLATRPAHDPEAGLWAWPAVQVDPDDEASWEEAAEIMGADLVDQMRESGSYMGYRVGIADDGRWQYFVAGD